MSTNTPYRANNQLPQTLELSVGDRFEIIAIRVINSAGGIVNLTPDATASLVIARDYNALGAGVDVITITDADDLTIDDVGDTITLLITQTNSLLFAPKYGSEAEWVWYLQVNEDAVADPLDDHIIRRGKLIAKGAPT